MKFSLSFVSSFLALCITAGVLFAHASPTNAQGKPADKPHKAVCGPAGDDKVRCHAHVIVDDKGNPEVNKNALVNWYGPYGPTQFQTAYNLSGNASGRILAIVDAYDDPHIQSDLNNYESTVGLTQLNPCSPSISANAGPCFQKVDQTGGTSYPTYDSGWALEESLDVEVANAACPTCKILLVEAKSSSYNDLLTAVDRAVAIGATVVSNSYGSNEFYSETSLDYHFNKTGVAFTFSSGDNGYGTSYPAASRYVTSVGGTTLYLNGDNTWNSEYVWNGTGSGCSSYESKQAWQPYIGCSRRVMNDVAADADPNTGAAVYDSDYYGHSGWFEVGGTSLASPLIAATYALNGIPNNYSQTANSLPYYNNPSANLHDIIFGSNTRRCRSSLCKAIVGFDGPTGLGTPHGINAF